MPLEQYAFGTGQIWAVRSDISNATPVRIGTCQDASVEFSYTLKPLTGQGQAPNAIARAGLKITGKLKSAKISVLDWNNIFFGQSVVTGELKTVLDEGGTSGTAPTGDTVTVVNAATWQEDLGAFNAATGIQLSPVASAPSTGTYSVAAGVYTFNAADVTAGLKVAISYSYTESTTGRRITGGQLVQGTTPTFKLYLGEQFGGNGMTLKLYNCVSSKLAIAVKNEDWVIPEIDFEACADKLQNVYDWSDDLL